MFDTIEPDTGLLNYDKETDYGSEHRYEHQEAANCKRNDTGAACGSVDDLNSCGE